MTEPIIYRVLIKAIWIMYIYIFLYHDQWSKSMTYQIQYSIYGLMSVYSPFCIYVHIDHQPIDSISSPLCPEISSLSVLTIITIQFKETFWDHTLYSLYMFPKVGSFKKPHLFKDLPPKLHGFLCEELRGPTHLARGHREVTVTMDL